MEITFETTINECPVTVTAECDSSTVEHCSPCVSGWSRGGDCYVGDWVEHQLVVEALTATQEIMSCDEDGNPLVMFPRGADLMPAYRASAKMQEDVEEAVIEYWQNF